MKVIAKTSLLVPVLLLLLNPSALAAPCCSGSALVPALITTDSKAQTALRVGHNAVVGSSRTDGSSVFNRTGNDEATQSFQMSAAYSLTPLLQIHAELPFSRRSRAIDATNSADIGISDPSAGAAYELIQELRYNQLLPRLWGFADVTAPVGKPIYESRELLQTDSHGRGAWAGTVGVFALKTWRAFDFNFLAEHRRYLPQTITVSGASSQMTLGPTTTLDAGVGYNFSDLRGGLSVGPTWDGQASSAATAGINAGARLAWTLSAQLAYTFRDVWSAVAAYGDQTLLGPTYNATLSRSASFTLTRRFE